MIPANLVLSNHGCFIWREIGIISSSFRESGLFTSALCRKLSLQGVSKHKLTEDDVNKLIIRFPL